jgi:hypothetical protein
MTESADTLSLVHANRLQPDALAANRSGVLTPEQSRLIRNRRRSRGVALIAISLICIAVAGWSFLQGTSGSSEGGRVGAVTVLIIGAILLVLRFTDFGRSFAVELAAGRVSRVDGFIQVRHSSSNRDSGTQHSYFYNIGGQEFEATEEGAKLIEPQSRYRIYYLPNSNIMVNIESLERGSPGDL